MNDHLKKQMVLMIRALYFSILEEWTVVEKSHNLSSAQQYILFILSSIDKPLTIGEVSKLGSWHKSTVTRLLKPLLSENYIIIKSGNGKYKYVSLTEKGKLRLKKVAQDVLLHEDFPFNFSGLDVKSIEKFLQVGMRMLKNKKGEQFTQWLHSSEPKAISISLK